eukprot:CAMPEP_0116060586 /NCGR_PEP_ID=MMETSP0322-20121206/6510_1 /TAXON_ID=163516 /ORGANISM="Leptocylindrus danicus var. apora, Strain B651" /LENGTH=665 /DNA_ID=CAMNT_0003545247 /DNA_START=52 /DNA_END=2049 /DNA_ORIENTATION=+
MSSPTAAPSMPSESAGDTGFVIAILTQMVIGFVFLLIFDTLYRRFPYCYFHRIHRDESLREKLPKIPSKGMFAWVRPVWKMTNDDLLRSEISVDAYMYLRFLDLMVNFFLYSVPAAVILMVVYAKADPQDEEDFSTFDSMTLANVKVKSNALWSTLICHFYFIGLLFYMIYKEYNHYVEVRHSQHFLTDQRDERISRVRRTVFVQDVPKDLRDEKLFNTFFHKLYPNDTIESTALAYDTRVLDSAASKRERFFIEWKKAKLEVTEDNERPKVRDKPCIGSKVDAIDFYADKIEELNDEIDDMQKELKPTSNAFVTFKSFDAVVTATQVKQTLIPFAFSNKLAMAPEEVIWKNLVQSTLAKKVGAIVGAAIIWMIVFFWTIPITLASSLSQLENYREDFEPIDWLFENLPALASFLTAFLPGLALILFKKALPYLCRAVSKYVKYIEGNAWITRDSFTSYFYFQLINFYLVAAIGGSALGSATVIADDPTSIVSILADALPKQWLTFASYIMIITFAGTPKILADISTLAASQVKLKYFAKTEEEKSEIEKPNEPMKYDVSYPDQLLISMVGLGYAGLAPIMTFFALAYFAYTKLVYQYRLVFVWEKSFDGGGFLFPLVFNRIIAGVFVSQFTLIGVLNLKEFFFGSPLLIIQVIVSTKIVFILKT